MLERNNMSYAKLRGRIKEKYGSEKKFAKINNISSAKLSRILNGRTNMKAIDLLAFIENLAIPGNEINEYFFFLSTKNNNKN